MGDFGFWAMVTVLTIFCYGEPDLLDSIIHYLQSCGG